MDVGWKEKGWKDGQAIDGVLLAGYGEVSAFCVYDSCLVWDYACTIPSERVLDPALGGIIQLSIMKDTSGCVCGYSRIRPPKRLATSGNDVRGKKVVDKISLTKYLHTSPCQLPWTPLSIDYPIIELPTCLLH